MLDRKQFIISFSEGMASVKITNPHGPGEFEVLDYEALKQLVGKGIKSIEAKEGVSQTQENIPVSLENNNTRQRVLEIKNAYESAQRALKEVGIDMPMDNSGYRVAVRILGILDQEIQENTKA